MLLNALPAIVGLVGLLGNILIYYIAAKTGVTYDNYMAFNVAFSPTSSHASGSTTSCRRTTGTGPIHHSG